MGKSGRDKVEFAQALLKKGIPYREIQEKLKEKFGSGMSNTTLKSISRIQSQTKEQDEKIKRLEQELELFKRLYFELANKTGEEKGTKGEKDEK